ncbi:MAG TPA: hypothetical protein VF552_11235 [Allosphingosinicella sp.]
MSPRTPEDLLVGLFALALVPLIAARLVRGVREGRVPVYRTYLTREENRAKFNVLLVIHALSLVLVAVVAADLLLGLGLRGSL